MTKQSSPNEMNRSPGPILAAVLDRLADTELQHGHHAAAERLAWRANELREGGR